MADPVRPTVEAMEQVARRIAGYEPDTIILMSPHGPLLRDRMSIGLAPRAQGTFEKFEAPQVAVQAECDVDLAQQLRAACDRAVIGLEPVDALTNADGSGTVYSLDHGAAVPLHFLLPIVGDVRVVLLGFSWLPRSTHLTFGRRIRDVCDASGKRIVFLASGDLSHRLTPEAPAGYDPRGRVFDDHIVGALNAGDWTAIANTPDDIVDGAGVCGYLSLLTLSGAMKQETVGTRVLSYQAPYGVGYAVAEMEPASVRPAVDGLSEAPPRLAQTPAAGEAPAFIRRQPRPFAFPEGDFGTQILALARASFESYAHWGDRLAFDGLPPAHFHEPRACFVTLHLGGRLRGCVGTILPVRDSLAEEVIDNAVGAASRDPRFLPLHASELPHIACSVDVLTRPEPVVALDMLDPARYGMVVLQGDRAGVLLPALPEVATVQDQYRICLQKAGIQEPADVSVYRFEVQRFAEPGTHV